MFSKSIPGFGTAVLVGLGVVLLLAGCQPVGSPPTDEVNGQAVLEASNQLQPLSDGLASNSEPTPEPTLAETQDPPLRTLGENPPAKLLRINEFMAANTTIPDQPGEFDDWVEIYNAGTSAVDIGGMYVTDDLAVPTKAQIPLGNPAVTTIPAGGFLVIWFDGQPGQGPLHVDPKLSAGGEEIGLIDIDGVTVIDSLTFGPQTANISYGRLPDGSSTWVYFSTASKQASNATGTPALPSAPAPVFSHPGGYCSGAVSLELSTDSPTARICYTRDGSEPTDGASETPYTYMYEDSTYSPYSSINNSTGGPTETRYDRTYLYDPAHPIPITTPTVVRARVFDTGKAPGPIVTHTYLLNYTSPLAVISLSANPSRLWNCVRDESTVGCLTIGPSPYGSGFQFPQSTLWFEVERAANLEFFEPDGTLGFNHGIGVCIGADLNRFSPQKPMALYARGIYGAGEINYPIFPGMPVTTFEGLSLRTSGDDWGYTYFQDALVQALARDLNVDTQAYRPTAIFLNGSYYGLINIRERRNDQYIASHYNTDPEALDILIDNQDVIKGSNAHYNALLTYLRGAGVSYSYVKSQMEVDNYLDYMCTEIISGNTDWPSGNVRYWRPQVPNGRWRWMILDTDYAFGSPRQNSQAIETMLTHPWDYNRVAHATAAGSSHWSNKPWSTELFRLLLGKCPEFKTEFARRMADHLNVTFQVDRVITEIDAKQAGIAGEMDAHIGRWGGVINPWTWPNNPWQKGIVSIDAWNSEVARMRTYAQNRIGPVRTHVANYCGLSTTLANLTFSVSPTGAGKIKVNRFVLPIPSGSNWTGAYFKAVPIEVAALPNKGYRFDGWSGITGGSVASITPTGDLTVTANFIADAAQQNPIVINEICYNAATDFATGDWVELYNPNAAGVDLSGWQFKDSNDDNIFTFPPHTTIGPGAYLVLCEDKIMFHSFFPAVENYLGNMTFNLSNGGELIRLYDAAGTPVDSLTYDDASPWPVEPDGTGPSLELKNPGVDNALAGVWAASTGHGTPGAANSAYIPPPQISGWDVVVTHGVVGEISTTATDGYIESRVSGLRTMRVRFDRPMDTSITDVGCVSIVGAVWGDWSGMVASLTWESATQVRIDLTGPLPDKDAFTIGLSKTVLSADGIGLDGDRDVLIHVRIGDAAGDGDVDNGDVIKVRNFKGQAVNSITYRCDVNADGIIDDADLTEVINHRDPLSP